MCGICSKLTVKTSEQRYMVKVIIKDTRTTPLVSLLITLSIWCCSGVVIVNFEHLSHLFVVHFKHVNVDWVLWKSCKVDESQVLILSFRASVIPSSIHCEYNSKNIFVCFVDLFYVSDLESGWICSSEDLLKVIIPTFIGLWYY